MRGVPSSPRLEGGNHLIHGAWQATHSHALGEIQRPRQVQVCPFHDVGVGEHLVDRPLDDTVIHHDEGPKKCPTGA